MKNLDSRVDELERGAGIRPRKGRFSKYDLSDAELTRLITGGADVTLSEAELMTLLHFTRAKAHDQT